MKNERHLTTLLLGFFYGCAGILLDLDHLIAVLVKELPVTLYNLSTRGSRVAHVPTLIVVGIVFCLAVSYNMGWFIINRRK